MRAFSRSICFFICIILTGCILNSIFTFKYKDGVEPMTEFYHVKENTIDVILLGASHIQTGINPNILWREQGITSYELAGSGQPIWNSYYNLKESLKYQSPKVVVIDTFTVCYEFMEDTSYTSAVWNCMGMRFSQNKIDAIKVSSPEDKHWDMFMAYPTYHSRYKDLTERDFGLINFKKPVYANGYYTYYAAQPVDPPNIANITEKGEILPKSLEYLIKIIDLAKENNIELVFIITPYAMREPEKMVSNTVEQIALENGCKFINYILIHEEIGFDWSTDLYNIGHLNCLGADKVSSHLASYIQSNFDIPDKRGNQEYQSWHTWAQQVDLAIADKSAGFNGT